MGASSRATDFNLDFKAKDCIDYFTDKFERWRKAVPK